MAKTFLEMLAEVPQIKKRTFWPLRKFRKSKKERLGICGSSVTSSDTKKSPGEPFIGALSEIFGFTG